jgi:hypothetical protein
MDATLSTFILGGAGIIAGIIVAYINKRRPKGDMVSQLWGRLDRLESREIIRDDYIGVLRQHIVDNKPPPPPPYPEELRHYDRYTPNKEK